MYKLGLLAPSSVTLTHIKIWRYLAPLKVFVLSLVFLLQSAIATNLIFKGKKTELAIWVALHDNFPLRLVYTSFYVFGFVMFTFKNYGMHCKLRMTKSFTKLYVL